MQSQNSKMNTLKTNSDFSKKSRNTLNERFSELRRLVEPHFPNVSDWNRFRIIDSAIALLSDMPLKQWTLQSCQPAQLSNKEACAFYRNKLNQSFDALKKTLLSFEIATVKQLKLHSRAALLEAAIGSLSAKLPLRSLPRPIIRVPKRTLDQLHSFSPDEKRPRSIGSTPSPQSTSPNQSPPAHAVYNQRLFLEHFMIAQAFSQFSPRLHEKADNFWRPW